AELDNYHLVSEYMDEQLAVVVFGDVPSTTAPPAETIARIWRTGGTDGVHSLDASFSAVIMELPHKRVHVVSDTMGLRGLHYFTNGSALLISPHDLCILATGLCPAELDRLSIASLLSCDWSLGGQPLLKNILSCEPDFYYIWGGGLAEKAGFSTASGTSDRTR
ncbi:MAG: hypothetical protein JW828_06170, partial [Sedimentisphaerales bacterium]|nr:hypothetical protein [Sedimentisphaerales bacterium]